MNAVERISLELLEELGSDARRLADPCTAPVRFTQLKEMARSPLHFKHSLQHHRDESLSMRLGTGAHALTFGTPRVVVYAKRRAGKEWDAFEAEHSDCVILNEREHGIASAMARELTTDFVAAPLLFAPGSKFEHEVKWELMGRACAGRIDALTPSGVVDLKAVKDGDPKWFGFQAARMRWAEQVTWYADGCEAAGLGWHRPHLVTVENAPPHTVTVYALPDEVIEVARRNYRAWFAQVLECSKRNEWPGYTNEVLELRIPGAYVPPINDEE